MSTRATQIELFLDPLIDPTAGCLCSGYTAYFYAAGTSTEKNIWTEKEKTNPFTSYDLDSAGKALLYGDGIYKIVVKNPDGTTVLSVDNQKIQATTFSVVQKAEAYTATPDDDVILCDGTFTVSLQAVANFNHPVVIKNIGAGTITVDPNGAETIDGSATVSIVNQYDAVNLYPDTTSSVWRQSGALQADLNGTELILDADGDTSVTADTDDIIDWKISGADQFSFKDGVIEPTTDNDINLGSSDKKFGTLYLNTSLIIGTVTKKTWKKSISAAASLEFDGLSAAKHYSLVFDLVLSGVAAVAVTINNDTGSNYYSNNHYHGYEHTVGEVHDVSCIGINSAAGPVIINGPISAIRIHGRMTFYGVGNNVLVLGNTTQIHTDTGFVINSWSIYYTSAAALYIIKIAPGSGTVTGEGILEELD